MTVDHGGDPLFDWQRDIVKGLEQDLERTAAAEHQHELFAAVLVLAGAAAVVAALIVRAF